MSLLRGWTGYPFALAILFSAGLAGAESNSIDIGRFDPAVSPEDGFRLSRPHVLTHREFGLAVPVSYTNDSLTLKSTTNGSSDAAVLIRHHLLTYLLASVGLWDRAMFFGGLGLHLLMAGDAVPAGGMVPRADGAGVGDLRLGARLLAWTLPDELGSLGLQVTAGLPVARWVDHDAHYRGESGATVLPEVLLELRPGGARILGNVGVRVRRAEKLGDVRADDELTYGLGVAAPLLANLIDLQVEGYGATGLRKSQKSKNTAVEVLVGASLYLTSTWGLGLFAGPGLSRAVGTPDFRAVFRATYRSGVTGRAGARPAVDSDGDGLEDARDECPSQPEDRDGQEDTDGCPDPDNDWDGVPDDSDRCPLEAEGWDGIADEDGCPDHAVEAR